MIERGLVRERIGGGEEEALDARVAALGGEREGARGVLGADIGPQQRHGLGLALGLGALGTRQESQHLRKRHIARPQDQHLERAAAGEGGGDLFAQELAHAVGAAGARGMRFVHRQVERRQGRVGVVEPESRGAGAQHETARARLLRGLEGVPGAPHICLEHRRGRARERLIDAREVHDDFLVSDGLCERLVIEHVDGRIGRRLRGVGSGAVDDTDLMPEAQLRRDVAAEAPSPAGQRDAHGRMPRVTALPPSWRRRSCDGNAGSAPPRTATAGDRRRPASGGPAA